MAPSATCHPSQGLCCNNSCQYADLSNSGIVSSSERNHLILLKYFFKVLAHFEASIFVLQLRRLNQGHKNLALFGQCPLPPLKSQKTFSARLSCRQCHLPPLISQKTFSASHSCHQYCIYYTQYGVLCAFLGLT